MYAPGFTGPLKTCIDAYSIPLKREYGQFEHPYVIDSTRSGPKDIVSEKDEDFMTLTIFLSSLISNMTT